MNQAIISEALEKTKHRIDVLKNSYPTCFKDIADLYCQRSKYVAMNPEYLPSWSFFNLDYIADWEEGAPDPGKIKEAALASLGKHYETLVVDYATTTVNPSLTHVDIQKHQEKDLERLSKDIHNQQSFLLILAAWTYTKGIYPIDADLFAAFRRTKLGKIPVEMFKRLPEWTTLLVLPEPVFANSIGPTRYMLASASMHKNNYMLQLMLLTNEPTLGGAISIPLNEVSTIDEVCTTLLTAMNKQKELYGLVYENVDADTYNMTTNLVEKDKRDLETVLSCLLYLCAEEPDLSRPAPPKPQINKVGGQRRIFPANGTTVVEVGYKIGSVLRVSKHRENAAKAEAGLIPSHPNQQRGPYWVPPHWNTYWTGPKPKSETDPPQIPRIKWLAGYLANKELGEVVPTVHAVKEIAKGVGA